MRRVSLHEWVKVWDTPFGAHPTTSVVRFSDYGLLAINLGCGLGNQEQRVVCLNIDVRNLLDAAVLGSSIDSMVTLEGEEAQDAGFRCGAALCTYVVGSSCQGGNACATCSKQHTADCDSKTEKLFHNGNCVVSD